MSCLVYPAYEAMRKILAWESKACVCIVCVCVCVCVWGISSYLWCNSCMFIYMYNFTHKGLFTQSSDAIFSVECSVSEIDSFFCQQNLQSIHGLWMCVQGCIIMHSVFYCQTCNLATWWSSKLYVGAKHSCTWAHHSEQVFILFNEGYLPPPKLFDNTKKTYCKVSFCG